MDLEIAQMADAAANGNVNVLTYASAVLGARSSTNAAFSFLVHQTFEWVHL